MISHPISYQKAKELIKYDPETGDLFWLPRNETHIKRPSSLKTWNTRYSNKKITTVDSKGYLFCSIFGKQYRAHRIAWLIYYGEWPNIIDHINGIRTDNRIVNMRSVNVHENSLNRGINSKNKSGVFGVYFNTKKSLWCAQMKFNGNTYHLGSSKDFFEAVCLRKSEERKLGFSLTHGMRK
tara:strand:+ start:385 stop:927 length:543 start_codon:yes stop_codon:yes gene_type:complete